MEHAIFLFREYMGTGLIIIWFLLSLIYLFLKEEQKQIRILFVYVPVILLLLFFNPVFAEILTKYMDDEIYYRILWLLPVTAVIAYTCVSVCSRLAGKKRLLCMVGAVVLMMVSGKYIYNNMYFKTAENWYHVPDSVVEICDAIELPGREVTAVFPVEMLQYVRQYSAVVCMPYGREILVEKWNEWPVQHELYDAMEMETIDGALLGNLARKYGCIYIILPTKKSVNGSLLETGYERFFETEGYVVYRNEELITF